MNKPVWIAAHLAALAMLVVGGWVTVVGFVLFAVMPSCKASPQKGNV